MNYFLFLGVSPLRLLVEAVVASAGIFLLAPLGFYFMGAPTKDGRRRLFGSIVVALIFLSTLACVLLAFAPLLVKPLILVSFVLPVPCWAWSQRKREGFAQHVIEGAKSQASKLSLFFALVCVSLVLWGSTKLTNGDLPFNGHENYFSGISLEIYKADYWGRLRVFDNYPLVWAKYHFFNGVMSSFPLFFFAEKNLASFQISKIIILFLLIFTLIESVDFRRTGWVTKMSVLIATLLAMQAFSHQLWWAIFTNNAASILLLLIFVLMVINSEMILAVLFLAGFGISTARSVFPAAFIFLGLLALSTWQKNPAGRYDNWRTFVGDVFKGTCAWFAGRLIRQRIYFVTSVVGIAFMVLTGAKTENPFRHWNIVRDFMSDGWSGLISSAPVAPAVTGVFNPNPWIFCIWCLLIVWVSCLTDGKVKIETAKCFVKKIKSGPSGYRSLFVASTILIALLAVLFVVKRPSYFLYYFLTVILFYLSVPERLSIESRVACAAFLCASIIELVVFSGQVSVPNFLIVEWLTWLFVLLKLIDLGREDTRRLKLGIVVSALMASIWFFVGLPLPLSPLGIFQLDARDENSTTLPYAPGNPSAGFYQGMEPVCELDSPKISALASLGGARSYFSPSKKMNTSVSTTFLKRDPVVMAQIEDICRAKSIK